MASDRAIRQMAILAGMRPPLTESVAYLAPGQDARTIRAMVDREQPVPVMQGQAAEIRVCVLNDASLGIDAATLDRGSDRIEVAEVVGREAKPRGIQRIVSQDSDFVTLAVV